MATTMMMMKTLMIPTEATPTKIDLIIDLKIIGYLKIKLNIGLIIFKMGMVGKRITIIGTITKTTSPTTVIRAIKKTNDD